MEGWDVRVQVEAAPLDAAVCRYIREKYGMGISRAQAAYNRRQIGTAYPPTHERICLFRGKLILTSEEIRAVYRPILSRLAAQVRSADTIYLYGSAAELDGLSLLITDECGCCAVIEKSPTNQSGA